MEDKESKIRLNCHGKLPEIKREEQSRNLTQSDHTKGHHHAKSSSALPVPQPEHESLVPPSKVLAWLARTKWHDRADLELVPLFSCCTTRVLARSACAKGTPMPMLARLGAI